MNRFKKIMVCVDPQADTHRALEHALPWVRLNQASLHLVGCTAIPTWMSRWFRPELVAAYEASVAEQLQRLEALAAGLRDEIGSVTVAVLKGNAAIETTREALRGPYDLLVKVASPDDGVADRLFGTDDMRLLRKCPCPVWIVGPNRSPSPQRIVAAVDPHPGGRDQNPLPSKILELASSLAKEVDAELRIAHVWRLYGDTMLRGRESEEVVSQLRKEERQRATSNLAGVLAGFEGGLAQLAGTELREGDPAHVIPLLTKQLDCDLLVMGTVARSGASGFLMGNTAELILSKVKCSVLTVKPNGFVSPVSLEPDA